MNLDTKRIFILDDEAIFALSVQHYLKKEGYSDVHRFETSDDLLDQMHQEPNVLILDHFLTDEIGLDVLKRVKKLSPDLTVIYLSAQKTAAIAIKAVKLGAFAYLEKDITDIQEIVEIIKAGNESNSTFLLK